LRYFGMMYASMHTRTSPALMNMYSGMRISHTYAQIYTPTHIHYHKCIDARTYFASTHEHIPTHARAHAHTRKHTHINTRHMTLPLLKDLPYQSSTPAISMIDPCHVTPSPLNNLPYQYHPSTPAMSPPPSSKTCHQTLPSTRAMSPQSHISTCHMAPSLLKDLPYQ